MKIYVDNEISSQESFLTLAKHNKNSAKVKKILTKLHPYLVKTQHIIDIYSKQGIYQVNENQIYKIHIKSETIHENIIMNKGNNKLSLVIDDSLIDKELVHKIPFEHVNLPLTIHKYSLNKDKLALVLVIEFIDNDNPINYYFEYNEKKVGNINCNNIPTQDINVFLSLLN